MSDNASAPTDRSNDAPFSAWYSLFIMSLVALFAMVDRSILSLMAEPVKQTLELTDLQLGLMQGTGIAVFAALAAFPIGWLADKFGKRIVLAGSVVVWSLAVVGCAYAQTFWQMFIATSMVGAGEAGLSPIMFALIPQLFGRGKRQIANSIFVLAAAASGGLGMVLAGQLVGFADLIRDMLPAALQALEAWRLSFLIAAAPAPLMVLLIATVHIKNKAQATQAADEPVQVSTKGPSLVQHFRDYRKTLVTFFCAMGMAIFSFGAVGVWLPVMLMRQFDQTPEQIGAALGSISLLGMFGGFLFVTLVLKKLESRFGTFLQIRAMSTAAFLCIFTSFALGFAQSANQIYVIQAVQLLCLTAANMLYPTVLQNLAPDALRARVIAIQITVNVGFGAAAGPLVGLVSDQMSDDPRGLITAASAVACVGLIISTLLFRWCESTYCETVEEIARLEDEQDLVPA